MKFSIVSLLVLTFWIALGIQTYFALSKAAEFSKQQLILENETSSLEQKTMFLQSENFDRKICALETDRDQLKVLDREFAEALAPEVSKLSEVLPRDNAISIRRVPLLDRPDGHATKLKIFVPKSQDISLHVELKVIGDEKELLSNIEWQPNRLVKVAVPPGMHFIEYQYKLLDDSTWFAAQLDGKEITRYTFNTRWSGHGRSEPTYNKQYDFRPGWSNNELVKITPDLEGTRILVYLSKSKK